jgi:hypothetical protein
MVMAMATALAADVQLLVRGRSRARLGGGDDLSPLFWFLRSAHCALCPPFLVRVLFQTTDRLHPL